VLVHLADETIDVILTVTIISSLVIMDGLLPQSSSGRVELEGPQEVVGFFEVGSDGVDFVDEILNADDSVLSKSLFNDTVVVEGNPLPVHLGVSSLVDEFLDALKIGVSMGGGQKAGHMELKLKIKLPIGEIGFSHTDHVDGSLVQPDESPIVDLTKTE